jgi:hypothetical protein
MLLPEQCRAARAALAWDVRALSSAAKVSTQAITRFEGGGTIRPRFLQSLRGAFEAAGVEFGHYELRINAGWHVERYSAHSRRPKCQSRLLPHRAVVALAIESRAAGEILKVKAPANASVEELDHLYKLGVRWL